MKIASIFAAVPGNHSGLIEIKKIVSDTLTELGVEPEEINLGYRSLPYYDGIKSEYMSTISECLASANGIIFYTGASFGLPGALIQTLLEHFNFFAYNGIMNNKNCFIIMSCDDPTGIYAMSCMELALHNMGAFCQSKLLIDRHFTDGLVEGDKRYIMTERLCEDYYRSLRQQRTVYRPQILATESVRAAVTQVESVQREPSFDTFSTETQQIPSLLNINTTNLNKFDTNQQKDIEELANFFASKLKTHEVSQNSFIEKPIVPVERSQVPVLIQKTSALTHYFKSRQADGLKANIALNISGTEGFEGYISINSTECDFSMGSIESPDVTIVAEDNKWADIIRGKISAQKAFMIGQIKVRGNFVLLSKFDQLFDFDKNMY